MNTLMSRPLCALLLFTASAWVHAQGENVDYGAAAPGYLALPAHNAKQAPALILIHEWWGLNDNIRDFAESFAKEGYVALAVDLYDGKVMGLAGRGIVAEIKRVDRRGGTADRLALDRIRGHGWVACALLGIEPGIDRGRMNRMEPA